MGNIVEIQGVRQRPDEGFRRWFSNNYFDLVFWYEEEAGELTGIQFCYGKPYAEKAFTWERSYKSHHYVSEQNKTSQATGILRGNAGNIPETVVNRFLEESPEMDEALKDLILDKIDEYNLKEKSKA